MANLQIVPAAVKNVEAQYVEMMVPLYSYGCEKKIKKALANLKGIYSVNVDFPQQKVTVWGICDKHDVLSIVRDKRKGATFWNDNEEDNAHIQDSNHSSPLSSTPNYGSASSKRYLAMIKSKSLSLSFSMMRSRRSINWRSLKKAFTRSNSF